MRRGLIALAAIVAVVAAAYGVRAGGRGSSCGTSASASGNACATGKSAAACDAPQGKVAGHFDPAMSGVCRYACATRLQYKAADVVAQPGATAGRLTQCPVSGVVFAVDSKRPRVRVGKDDYVTCCDRCAEKLKPDPRHYLKA